MYRNHDIIRILAAGLAAAVMISLPQKGFAGAEAAESCLLFPQFTQAAAIDRETLSDGGEITYSFRLLELLEELFG